MVNQHWVVAAVAAATFSFSAQANELDSLRDLQLQLLERFDMLQQEVQLLRGVVEEQARTIETLQSDGRSRYLDLDQRITALGVAPAPTQDPGLDLVAASGAQPVADEPTAALGDPALENERYQAAFSLIRERQFDQAQQALRTFIAQYPGGKLLADAKYWLAQVYEAEGIPDLAIQSFSTLLAEHPEYRRAAQAKFKLGRLHLNQGDAAMGQALLRELIEADETSELAAQARDLLNG